MKNAVDTRSTSSTSISIVSPGSTICLNCTLFARVATGHGVRARSHACFDSSTAPACIAASHRSTPGVIGKSG